MLRDHFRPPLARRRPWHATHHAWATAISAALNERLPPGWFAAPNVQFGIEIDVAAFDESESWLATQGAAAKPLEYVPPPPVMTPEFLPATDVVEVEIFAEGEELRLAGAVELISPANKDRADHRRAFLNKCEYLLRRGVGLAVIDIVTTRKANLHVALLRRFGVESAAGLGELYASSYRPVPHDELAQLDVWESKLGVGAELPTIPLPLLGWNAVALDLEPTYERACREQRIS